MYKSPKSALYGAVIVLLEAQNPEVNPCNPSELIYGSLRPARGPAQLHQVAQEKKILQRGMDPKYTFVLFV